MGAGAGAGAGRHRPSRLTLRVLVAIVVAGALVAVLTAARGGGAAAPLDDGWRARTAATLASLLEPTSTFPVFVAPERAARLAPVAEAAIALRAAGRPVPPGVAPFVERFWSSDRSLYADAGDGLPALVTTWLAVRAAGPGPHAAAIATAVARADGSWEPGGEPDAVARLYAVRLRALLGLPDTPGSGSAGCGTPARLAPHLELGALVACPRARLERRLAGVRPGIGLPELEAARGAALLRRRGLVGQAAADRLLAPVAEALRTGTVLPGEPQGATVTGIRAAVDVLRLAGLPVVLGARAEALLRRTIRFRGRLPEVVQATDPLETVLGFHALRLAGAARELPEARAAAPAERAVLAAGAGAIPAPADVAAAAEVAAASPGARELALASVLAARGGCPTPLRTGLPPVVAALASRRAAVAAAPAHTLHWLAHVVAGGPSCGVDTGALGALVRRRLDRLAGADGVLVRPGDARGDLLASWWASEAACELGARPAITPAGVATLARTHALPGGGARADDAPWISPVATYALLRLDALARSGCAPPWWRGG
jgi:hypothetical protein